MFVDVSIKFTESELQNCKKLLEFLQSQPEMKLGALADQLIEEAHKEVKQEAEAEAKVPEPTLTELKDKIAETQEKLQNSNLAPNTASNVASNVAPAVRNPVAFEDVSTAAKELNAKKGINAFIEALKRFDAKRLSEIPKEKYSEAYEYFKEQANA